jgi:hypothetical protein
MADILRAKFLWAICGMLLEAWISIEHDESAAKCLNTCHRWISLLDQHCTFGINAMGPEDELGDIRVNRCPVLMSCCCAPAAVS